MPVHTRHTLWIRHWVALAMQAAERSKRGGSIAEHDTCILVRAKEKG
jgi:hypothetical protein